jgi:hypothetical protein
VTEALTLTSVVGLGVIVLLAESAGATTSIVGSVQLGLYLFIAFRIAFAYIRKLMHAISLHDNLFSPFVRGMHETAVAYTFCWPRTVASITRCLYTPRLQTLREKSLPRWKRYLINISPSSVSLLPSLNLDVLATGFG